MFFYGWLMVIAGFLILTVSWGSQYSFSVFLIPLTKEFGWSRANTAGIFSFNILVFGLGSIFAGRVTERLGPRLVIGVGGALVGGGLLLSALVQEIWQLYLYGVVIGLGLSAGYGPLVGTISRWFIARRGLVMGVMTLGMSIGILALPPLSRYLITAFGWRASFSFLGLLTGVTIIGCALLMKGDPKEKGLAPYGGNLLQSSFKEVPPGSPAETAALEWSFSEALSTKTFWTMFVAYLLWCTAFFMVTIHLAAHATDMGFSPMASALAISLIGGGSIFGKIFMGLLSDRIGPLKVITINLFLQGLCIFGLISSSSATWLYICAALFGFGYGGTGPQLPIVTAQFFGLSSLASIFGVLLFSGQFGGAIGPFLGGKIFDLSHSYFWAFFLNFFLQNVL